MVYPGYFRCGCFLNFSELKSPSGSLIDHLSWRELLACHSDLNVPEVFSFFQTLPFSRPTECPCHFTIESEVYPWVEHMDSEKNTSTSSIIEAIRVSIHHPRFLIPDGTP